MAAVAVEGAVAVVADIVAGARLCLALIYVWKRRGEGQNRSKGMGLTWHGQGKGWRGQLWGWVKLGHEGISNACSHTAVVLPPLVPKAVRWQMPPHCISSCTATVCPSCPLCFGLARTRALSTIEHPQEAASLLPGQHSCQPRCLQVLTQAVAGSRIKGAEAQASVADMCPRGVGAELAAVV